MEATKRETQATRILRLLRRERFVTNAELNKICFRYSARIHELRDDGWNIQREYWKPGVYRYWLVPERDVDEVA